MTAEPIEVPVEIKLRAGNWAAYRAVEPEILVEGPARTGKTFAILLRLVTHAQEVSGYKGLIVRKVAANLGTTILRTLEEEVFHQWDTSSRRSLYDHVHFFGGSANEPQAYEFDNGSRIVVGGMDQASKVLGSEYDEIYANEVVEFTVEDIETLLSRLSHGLLEHQCFISDCNPSHSQHWVLQRATHGRMRRIKTYLKDNPAFYDDEGNPTDRGKAYISTISALTGTRYQRLVLGEWVGVENALYPHFDRSKHVRPLEPNLIWRDGAIGADYGRRHKAGAIPVRVDQFGRRWVFEAWGQPDIEHGRMTEAAIGRFRNKHHIRRVRVGPDMDIMVGMLGANEASLAEGPRRARVDEVAFLLNEFPGGLVPESRELAFVRTPNMVTTTPDSPGLLFVEGGEGIEELCIEMENYHEVRITTDRKDELVIARIDDDLVSALEYACEELRQPRANYSRMLPNAPMVVK